MLRIEYLSTENSQYFQGSSADATGCGTDLATAANDAGEQLASGGYDWTDVDEAQLQAFIVEYAPLVEDVPEDWDDSYIYVGIWIEEEGEEEVAAMMQCPRCKGHASTSADKGECWCWVCNGEGECTEAQAGKY